MGDAQDAMGGFHTLFIATCKRRRQRGARNVWLSLRTGVAMHGSAILCDVKLRAVPVSRLREGGFNTILTLGAMHSEQDGLG